MSRIFEERDKQIMEITFLGATGTVTGSKYLVSAGSKKLLIDCGLFQGFKQLRLRNWEPLPIKPRQIDAVLLTHAHLDHSGYIPLLVREGFSGKIYSAPATRDLCRILLPDGGFLQEEDAAYANKKKFSKHAPALPLYTQEDAERSLRQVSDRRVRTGFRFRRGSQFSVQARRASSRRRDDLLMAAPSEIGRTDYLVIESTYGNRRHDPADPKKALAAIINRTVSRGGIVVIPSFAVGRAQTVLYLIHLLKAAHEIPDIPVYLNSPMAVEATDLHCDHREEHRLAPDQCRAMCRAAQVVNSVKESKRVNGLKDPMILISASGMATGGRVLHAAPLISRWIRENVASPVLIGPDRESEQWVSEIAAGAGAPYLVLEKIRRGDREVEVSVPETDRWRSYTPALADNIISTAKTMIETVGHLRRAKLPKPVCIGIHAIFADRAENDLLQAGASRVVTCNTIPHPTNAIDLGDLLAEGVRKMESAA